MTGAATIKPWAAHDTRLTVITVIGIAIIVLLIVVLKMNPFLALILGSAFVGLAAPVPLPMIVTNFEDGVGSTLKEGRAVDRPGGDARQAAGRLRWR